MRTRITPSLVLSIIAVVFSLTGVGYAATQLPRDSVGSAQIKAGAVGSAEVADGSLRPTDFSDAAKDALEGKRGARGAKGATGAQGPAGPAGPPGPAGAGASGGGSDVTVTDANGVVVGALQSVSSNLDVWVRTPNGMLAAYSSTGDLRSQSLMVSFNADCSPPFFVRARSAPPFGYPGVPYGGTTAYVTSRDAPISPAPSSVVYPIGSGCTGTPADTWDSPPSFIRMEPVAVADVPLSIAVPLTFG